MSVVFKKGQILGRGDISIFLKTNDGNPTNAYDISYNIYDNTTGCEVLLPPVDRTPANPNVPFFAGRLDYITNVLVKGRYCAKQHCCL